MKKTLFTFKKRHFKEILAKTKTKRISRGKSQRTIFPNFAVTKLPSKAITYDVLKKTAITLITIGNLTRAFLNLVGNIVLLYLRSVKRTSLRFVYVIQLIGELTQLLLLIVISPLKSSKLINKHLKRHIKLSLNAPAFDIKAGWLTFLKHAKVVFFYEPPVYAYVVSLSILTLWGSFYIFFLAGLPSPYLLTNKPLPQSSKILDRNGYLLYTVYNGKVNRLPVSLASIPAHMRQATIAIEDQEFYSHNGISVRGILRALNNNIHSEKVQGGSTITQQLVKIAILKDPRRTIDRKLKEAYLSLLIEKAYTKDQILEYYLNNAPYGGTAYGVEAASRKYFSKSAKDLTLAESALLASLPSAPSIYSPYSSDEKVYKSKQKHVLDRMVADGYINKEQANQAYNEQLAFYSIENQIIAPHFVFYVLDELEKQYGKILVQEGGLEITTTLDLPTQLKAQQIVKDNVEQVEEKYWISNAASLITEPKTGKILAMVGSRDYFDTDHDGNVNITTSLRQPGSSIKVVNYAYALSSGKFFASSVIDDSPITYSNQWETYSPKNYDGKYRGRVTIKQALAMSLNIPAVKVLASYGADKMREMGIQMGIKSWKNLKAYGLSLTLGGAEVKMTELATAYGTLANMGKRKDLVSIEKIVDTKGKILDDASVVKSKPKVLGISQVNAADDESSVLPEYTAYQLTSILSDNAARLPAFGPFAKLEVPGHKVAVKTGTTNDIRDNWTIGYTPDYLVATWVGNNDNSRMNPYLTSGITGAAPIWNEIMTLLLEGKPETAFATPSGMIKVTVCAVNGLLTCARCPKESEEYFIPGTEPKTACYFPSAEECKGKKDQMTGEGKSPDELNKALVNCPAGSN